MKQTINNRRAFARARWVTQKNGKFLQVNNFPTDEKKRMALKPKSTRRIPLHTHTNGEPREIAEELSLWAGYQ